MFLAHVAKAIDLAADAHPGPKQIIIPRGLVCAHGGACAVPGLKNGDVVGARGVGRRAAPGDAAQGVGFSRGNELGGLEDLFRAQPIEGPQRVVRAPGRGRQGPVGGKPVPGQRKQKGAEAAAKRMVHRFILPRMVDREHTSREGWGEPLGAQELAGVNGEGRSAAGVDEDHVIGESICFQQGQKAREGLSTVDRIEE